MKTSNKLLLGFAALLIIIPMIVLAINVKMNYVTADKRNYLERQEINEEPFNNQSVGILAIPILKPFNGVNFADAKMNSIEIHLTKSENYGVKIPDYMKDYLTFDVNENGMLTISLKGNISSTVNNKVAIVIYSPTCKKLGIANAENLELSAISDSLLLNVANTNSFNFSGAVTFNDDKGKVYKTINQTEVGHLSLHLINSSFYSAGKSYQDLIITTNNNSKVELSGSENEKEKNIINNLIINTMDTADVSINNMLIKNCSGKISDHTKLEMPVVNLRQLFKN